MRKTCLLVLFLLLTTSILYSQINRIDYSAEIYYKVLSNYETANLTVKKVTVLSGIKQFRFNDPNGHELKVTQQLSSEWKDFLKDIDTANIKTGPVSNSILKKYNRNPKSHLTLVSFSPVIFSGDKKKAVCSIQIYNGPEQSGEQVYLLEKNKGKWIVIKQYMLSIS